MNAFEEKMALGAVRDDAEVAKAGIYARARIEEEKFRLELKRDMVVLDNSRVGKMQNCKWS